MVGRIILLILLALIGLIFFLPYGVDAGYEEGVLFLRAKAGPLRLTLYPKKPLTARQLARKQKKKEKAEAKKKAAQASSRGFQAAAAPMEIDLRGMSADEAVSVLSLFLDNAWRAHLQTVRIIHGKGTGVLRKAVQQYLKQEKNIKSFRLGVYGEGEDGVTIAEFR